MLLLVVLIGIVAGLGFVVPEVFWAAAGLGLIWLAGWVVRADGARWFWW
jgi:hypothetical protein